MSGFYRVRMLYVTLRRTPAVCHKRAPWRWPAQALAMMPAEDRITLGLIHLPLLQRHLFLIPVYMRILILTLILFSAHSWHSYRRKNKFKGKNKFDKDTGEKCAVYFNAQ